MNQCLVTKLKGAVSDSSLMRLGEFRIKVNMVTRPTSRTQGFTFTFNKDVQIEIIGNGYFTNKALTANNGKTMNITANTMASVYVSNGDFEVAVLDKYSLVCLLFYAQGEANVTAAEMSNRSMTIDDLKYSTALTSINLGGTQVSGDISALQNLTALTSINLYSTQVSGDISALQNLTALTYINLGGTQVSGDISALQNLTALTSIELYSPQVSGDISALQNLTALTYINLGGTQVSGDISALQNLTALTYINLYSTQVSGDISALQNLTALTYISLGGTQGNLSSLSRLTKLKYCSLKQSKITGDLASLASTCYFVSFQNDNGSTLTWTTRSSSANIIAIEGKASLANIDKMLQDQAQCVKAIPASGELWFKNISVAGTRTSASDAAVATLQEKGYTVSITKA